MYKLAKRWYNYSIKSKKELVMKGSIRVIAGLLIAMGAVGGLDAGSATLTEGILASIIGLAIMASGVKAMNGGKLFA
jgi:hypothetical protein